MPEELVLEKLRLLIGHVEALRAEVRQLDDAECLILNRYQAIGLHRTLVKIMEGETTGLNGGDYIGEIRWMLEQSDA